MKKYCSKESEWKFRNTFIRDEQIRMSWKAIEKAILSMGTKEAWNNKKKQKEII